MKPDSDHTRKRNIHRRLFCIPVFFYFSIILLAQETASQGPYPKFLNRVAIMNIEKIRLSFTSPELLQSKPVPAVIPKDEKTTVFLDSLKNKASKTLITRKLYDFMITPHTPSPSKEIDGSSESGFISFSGKRIRNIKIQRLNVFGSKISSPDYFNPNKTENLLNKTHINTLEIIIRKNLLFRVGDTISPLTLSDNERYLRELPFIDDARILIVPVSETDADILVITKDVYSIGAKADIGSFRKGSISVFEKNIFGMGHEFGVEVPFNSEFSDSPGLGVHYRINNISKSFLNLGLYYIDGLGRKNYGFDLSRKLVSAITKYAGGISINRMYTFDDLDSLPEPAPVNYNFQDYWLIRSFLLNKESVFRFILGARYINNNIFAHPYILPDSYYRLQRYKMFMGSLSFSIQKYYKTNLVYGYGRTEDIPYGGLFNLTAGREINEFKKRTYLGTSLSVGESIERLGYFYAAAGFGTFYNEGQTEQGTLLLRTNFISNLGYIGRYRIRNFLNFDYTRGFDRYSDEYLVFIRENGFSGFRNDSTGNSQRLAVSFESVLFSPANFYGFKFALFGFADLGYLFGTNEFVTSGDILSSVGVGVRIRNDNLVFNTLQIRLCFYPNLPENSRINHLIISGEQLLKPNNFEPDRPSILPYK